ncbi:MAG: NAD(+)/NADH kinase [Oscillospiraceae bacterium]|nr:NAD(+)/NADH kinase [Oscillospiraceae bacterium]
MSERKIILYPNIDTDIGLKMTKRVADILTENRCQVVICPISIDDSSQINSADISSSAGYRFSSIENELDTSEMIITFGGDGTILRAARAASELSVPILGINLGSKGFMAELEVDDTELLKTAANGDYKIETRIMLDVEIIRENEVIYKDFILNDVAIKGETKVIDLTIFGDNQKITHFHGDGVVIATPTGSTAYSMSAGGPIVDPAAKNIIITPICAHMLEARSFVLVLGRIVTIEIGYKRYNPAHISVDGAEPVSIQSGDIVKVYKSERNTQLVRLSDKSFYRKVSEKLGER